MMKINTINLYRAFQVHHISANHLVYFVGPIIIPSAELLIVMSMFIVLRFHTDVGALSGIMGGITLFIFKIAISKAVDVTESSEKFSKNALKFNNSRMSKAKVRYIKSCRPLEWRIGHVFTVTRDLFPRILNDIIISNVINLLLAF
jgi:hypothetical protein